MKKKVVIILLAAMLIFVLAACGEQKTPKLEIEKITITSIKVVAVDGAEYSKDGGESWQDSNTFAGLTPSTKYGITIRMKATEYKAASKAADVQEITTLDKESQTAPTLATAKTDTTITITAVTGAEYSKDDGTTWVDNNVFENLTANTAYDIAIRLAETAVLSASPKTQETITTAAKLETPANFEKTETKITWGAVTNATKYVVTVDLEDDGAMGSETASVKTVVRIVSFPYEIEVDGTSIDITDLPYDCDLSISVRAISSSENFVASADTAPITLNRGSIFDAVRTYSQLTLNGNGSVSYYASLGLIQDLVIESMEQGNYTKVQGVAAYETLFGGTPAERAEAAAALGNDFGFAIYEEGAELTASNVFAKNKFWDNAFFEGVGSGNGDRIAGTIGFDGYTLSKENRYYNANTFTDAISSHIDVTSMYGKTMVAEVGVLLNGIYYGYVQTFVIGNPAA